METMLLERERSNRSSMLWGLWELLHRIKLILIRLRNRLNKITLILLKLVSLRGE